jgi:hypothetical protein
MESPTAQEQVVPSPSRPKFESDLRRLSVGAMNFGIPTTFADQKHVDEHHGSESWRSRVIDFLHSQRVQVFLMSLLALDVVILFVEIFLLATYPTCHVVVRDAISCCPATDQQDLHAERYLSGDEEGHHEDLCALGLEPVFEYEAGCDPHKWSRVHRAEEFLFGITITILSVFMLELTVSMLALTPQIFFRQFFYLVDFVIVAVSLSAELAFHFLNDDTIQSLVGLIVFARVWRFVRIGHGIIEVTHQLSEKAQEELLEYAEELEKLLRENSIDIPNPEKIQKFKHNSASAVPSKIESNSQKSSE